MAGPKNGRRAIGGTLISLGVILLIAVAGWYGWTLFQGEKLRAELRQASQPITLSATAEVNQTPVTPPTAPSTEPAATATEATLPTAVQPALTVTGQAAGTQTPAPTATGAADAQAAPASPQAPAPAGPPVRVVIPDLHLDAKVVEMGWQVVQTAGGPQSEWVIPQNEAGHHIDSVQLNTRGNVVISGHNNIYGRVFQPISQAWDEDGKTRIDDVTDRSDILDGQTVQLFNTAGERFDYTITAFYRLKDTGVSTEQRIMNARFIQPTTDPQLTLVTCWPPQSNTHRLVVIARPAGQ
jgi:sortase A